MMGAVSSDLVRCPICRTAIVADDAAWDAHMKTHSTWAMLRATWRIDRTWTALSVALVVMLGIVVAIVLSAVLP